MCVIEHPHTTAGSQFSEVPRLKIALFGRINLVQVSRKQRGADGEVAFMFVQGEGKKPMRSDLVAEALLRDESLHTVFHPASIQYVGGGVFVGVPLNIAFNPPVAEEKPKRKKSGSSASDKSRVKKAVADTSGKKTTTRTFRKFSSGEKVSATKKTAKSV